MAAKGQNDAVNWDLDWDDLTEGQTNTPNVSPGIPGQESPRTSLSTPPPLPQRAFPTPAPLIPDAEPAPILAVQKLPTSHPGLNPGLVAPDAPKAAGLARTVVRGQRVRLAELLPGNPPPPFEAVLSLKTTTGQGMDLSCFGLDETGNLSDDRFFIFFNQKSSPEGALSIRGLNGEIFAVDLGRLPSGVKRLVFTATVDGAGSVRGLGASRFELRLAGGETVARYDFSGVELENVQALMVAEIYFKDGWRLGAVGQGFAGGLSELLKYFGGQEM